MDIKLKNFSTGKAMKGIAFFLCVLFFLASLTGVAYIFRAIDNSTFGDVDDVLLYSSYEKSAMFQKDFDYKLNDILFILDEYKGEEYIKSGGTITDQRLDEAMRSMFYNGSYEETTYYTNGNYEAIDIAITSEYLPDYYGGHYDDPAVRARFWKDYADKVEEIRKNEIESDLQRYYRHRKELDRIEGFTYFAGDGVNVITNLQRGEAASAVQLNEKEVALFEASPAHLIYMDGEMKKIPASPDGFNGSLRNFDKQLESRLTDHYDSGLQVCFAYDESYLTAKSEEFNAARNEIMQWLPMTLLSALAALILLIYLLIFTGEREEEGRTRIRFVDRLFTEIQVLAVTALFFGGGALFFALLFDTVRYGASYDGSYFMFNTPLYLSISLAAAAGLVFASLGLYFILAIVRNVKAGGFMSNSIIWIMVSSVWKGLKATFLGSSLMKRVVLITLAICLLSSTIIAAPIVAAVVIVLAPKWVKKFEAVRDGIREVKNGNLSYKIKADGDSVLDELARDINEISRASEKAIQNELKNQRMKTDLISNVSHDLKTPLTSIITYIDLLKKEGLDHPDAPKYLEVLDQKSLRLKKLTEDLFEAAKASSGAIPVRFAKVDLLSLINQGLGEMGDRIEESGLEFRINAAKDKYYVRADGQLLWRVVENLLGNVLKYAQEGSRVYLDLTEQDGGRNQRPMTILEMKNISKDELNIDAEELMERFKRGDESRTTEGSGLGLAIAKDLMRLQNGRFDIKIDGDLFKAIVTLEPWTTEMVEEL